MSSKAPHAADCWGLLIGAPTLPYRRATPWLCLVVTVVSAAHLLQLAADRVLSTAQPAAVTVISGNQASPGGSRPEFLPMTGYDTATGAAQQAQCLDLLPSGVLPAMTTQELAFLDGLKCPSSSPSTDVDAAPVRAAQPYPR